MQYICTLPQTVTNGNTAGHLSCGIPIRGSDTPHDTAIDLNILITKTCHRPRSVGDTGQLLVEWARLEERLLPRARQLTERNISVKEALQALVQRKELPEDLVARLDQIRRVRNIAAHTPGRLEGSEVEAALNDLRELQKRVP